RQIITLHRLCTRISRYTQWTQYLQWLSASTTLSVVLTKFSGRMASLLKMKVVLITSYQS
ncbi:isocitrate lyase family protein, partial [Vibrio parahaemolyticus V-223/04]